MPKKPTYEELEQRVRELETEVARSKSNEEEFERERNIFLESPVVIFKWSAKENWSTGYVSPNVTQFGYLGEDFMSGSVLYIDIIHPEDREKFVREVQENSESGVGSYEQEYRIIQADGEIKWIYDFTVVGRNDKNEITHYDGYIVDITVRKLAEDALRRSEKQASTAIEAARALTFAYDIPTGKIEWRGAIEKITGDTPEEFSLVDIGGWEERIHPDDRDRVLSILQEAFQSDRAVVEYRFKTKHGDYITLSSISLTEENEEGKAVRLVGILQDITERKKAEEALEMGEARLRTILESAQDGIVLSDFDTGERQYVNQALADMLGYTKEQLLTMRFRDNVGPEAVEMFKDIGRKMIRTQKAVRGVECEMIKEDGSRIIVSSSEAPLTNAEGRITGVVGIMRDITKHKQAEKEIKKARDDYRTITTLIADIIVQVDAEGCFTFLNDHACTFWGYPRENMIGTSFYDYIHSDDRERSSDIIQKAIMEKREERGLINRQKTKEGYKTIEWNGVPFFDRNEQYIGFQASGRDITDRIQATENLKEMNSALKILLKQRDRDKNEIEEKVLTNVKELISPYLEKLHKSPLNDSQSNLLTIIESNIDEIVSPFLHRLSSKYSDLTPREIQVAGLVKDGKTSKEIAEILASSMEAIAFHRKNLRKNLGLRNTKSNLRSYLLSFP